MDAPIGGQRVSACQIQGRALHIRNFPARFLDHQCSGSDVPCAETELPKAIHPAAGDVGELECSGTGGLDCLHARQQLFPEAQIEAAAFGGIMRKAGQQKRGSQSGGLTHSDRLSIQPGALATLRDEQLSMERIEDDAELDAAAMLIRDRNAKRGTSMREVGGSVERIDYPSMVTAVRAGAALFGQDRVIGKGTMNSRDDRGLGLFVGFGDEIEQVAFAGGRAAMEPSEMNSPRSSRGTKSYLFYVNHRGQDIRAVRRGPSIGGGAPVSPTSSPVGGALPVFHIAVGRGFYSLRTTIASWRNDNELPHRWTSGGTIRTAVRAV